MASLRLLRHFIGAKPLNIPKEELPLLEALLFTRVYKGLREMIRKQYSCYFQLLKFTTEMEEAMIDENFTKFMINGIIATGKYTLQGIAHYINTTEDVVFELACGTNIRPSAALLYKLIELHYSVRQDLYRGIIKKYRLT